MIGRQSRLQSILRQKDIETGELAGNVTNFQSSTGSMRVLNHWELWTKSGTSAAFAFHTDGHDLFNSPQALLAPFDGLGSTFLKSGGDF